VLDVLDVLDVYAVQFCSVRLPFFLCTLYHY